MMKNCSLVILAVLLLSSQVWAYSAGPINGVTNAPGEANCTMCHFSFALDSGAGSVTISGMPAAYTPGVSYLIQVSVADPQASRWGFECTILNPSGTRAGLIGPVDGLAQTSFDWSTGRKYAKHTTAGNRIGTPNGVSWTLNWVAPVAGTGDVTLYVCGNAANSSFDPIGDYIYSNTFTSTEGNLSPVPEMGLTTSLHPAYPNPFNPSTALSFTLASAQDVSLGVYDLQGHLVRTIFSGSLPAGTHSYMWHGRNDQRLVQAAGMYLGRLRDAVGADVAAPIKMTVIK